LMWKK